jgi:hypothetical protein
MTKMNLRIEHQVPGRVRMKIPAGKGNPDLLKQISEVFGVIPGIEQITVNPTTGSVVLHYDADRHDEFHGNFQQHYEAHGAAHGAANGGMHPSWTSWQAASRRRRNSSPVIPIPRAPSSTS